MMNRILLAVACLATAVTGTSGGADPQPARYADADLPPLMEFLDGTPVRTMEDLERRKQEIRRLFCQYFIGSFPGDIPEIIGAEILQEKKKEDGSTRRQVKLTFDTPNRASFEMWVWTPKGDGPFPLLLTQPRFYQSSWAEDAVRRGCIACLYPGLDVHHKEKDYPGYENVWRRFKNEYPEASWESSLAIQAWLASRALDYLLDPKYGHDVAQGQVRIIGFSRYGKQSLYAAAFDERFTSVVARSSGSPTAVAYRFAGRQTFMESIEDFPSAWARASLRAYHGRENELPIEGHGLLALIAPRRCMLQTAQSDRPNILWLIAENMGSDLACYGQRLAKTPNLDRLASEGVLYRRFYTSGAVCSPSRSAVITGMYQTTIGAQNHRSHRRDGYRLPEGVDLVMEPFRQAGYFTANVTLRNDPHELKNLAGSAEHRQVLNDLRATLDKWIERTRDEGAIAEDPAVLQFWLDEMEKQFGGHQWKPPKK